MQIVSLDIYARTRGHEVLLLILEGFLHSLLKDWHVFTDESQNCFVSTSFSFEFSFKTAQCQLRWLSHSSNSLCPKLNLSSSSKHLFLSCNFLSLDSNRIYPSAQAGNPVVIPESYLVLSLTPPSQSSPVESTASTANSHFSPFPIQLSFLKLSQR